MTKYKPIPGDVILLAGGTSVIFEMRCIATLQWCAWYRVKNSDHRQFVFFDKEAITAIFTDDGVVIPGCL